MNLIKRRGNFIDELTKTESDLVNQIEYHRKLFRKRSIRSFTLNMDIDF